MENEWSKQEKDVFLTLLQVSASVIENKKKNLNSKMIEWHSVQKKFKELTGKKRSVEELKNKWESMKRLAKSHLQRGKVSSSEYIKVLAICLGIYNEGADFDLSKLKTELQIEFEPPVLCFEPNKNLESDSRSGAPSGETSTGKRKSSEVENESEAESDKRQALLEEEFKLKKFVLEKQLKQQDYRHKLEVEILGLKKKIMQRRLDLLNQKRISRGCGVNNNEK